MSLALPAFTMACIFILLQLFGQCVFPRLDCMFHKDRNHMYFYYLSSL